MFSEVTDELVVHELRRTTARARYFKDKALEADYNCSQSKLPGKEVGFGSRTDDEQLWVVVAASDTEPGETLPLRPRDEEA